MNSKTLFQRFECISDEIKRLQNSIFALQSTDFEEYRDNYEELSTNAALRAERIACQLRSLVYVSNSKSKENYMKQAALAHEISIQKDGPLMTIRLPGLLTKRKVHINTAFLSEPLNYAMQDYVRIHSIPLFENCVVCFSQIYDQQLPLQRIRDYDNLEFKQILDTIATYVLRDDTGLFCDMFHTTQLGEKDCTIIYVMEKNTFPEWLKSRKDELQNISEIS